MGYFIILLNNKTKARKFSIRKSVSFCKNTNQKQIVILISSLESLWGFIYFFQILSKNLKK